MVFYETSKKNLVGQLMMEQVAASLLFFFCFINSQRAAVHAALQPIYSNVIHIYTNLHIILPKALFTSSIFSSPKDVGI
jgi:hypothetical protein